ncbi:hypothetical protein [Methanothermococcus okinawensis]|uniref:Uncharacterized protein n=1 Tax=Methanothermococcus okinawensis (strain DSM 14208 / JCM 11175 / IH1) TaxID=647113 RepID=F8AKA5_METOI|nr:hypothetical protein [Methanothermococcus okinawensis]AEH06305.1 hypothetical protein Metok_0315 [Methanothermococcus okinawensis IH1]
MRKNSKLLDAVAQRYGCLPSDILNLSVVEFNINIAVAVNSADTESEKKGCKVKVVDKTELNNKYKELLRRYNAR